jgi:hypothetical protein
MLEGMRRQGASISIYIIFGILIAVFVINFGPQSRGQEQGCSSNAEGPDPDGVSCGLFVFQDEWCA